jgi:hypothetical protein
MLLHMTMSLRASKPAMKQILSRLSHLSRKLRWDVWILLIIGKIGFLNIEYLTYQSFFLFIFVYESLGLQLMTTAEVYASDDDLDAVMQINQSQTPPTPSFSSSMKSPSAAARNLNQQLTTPRHRVMTHQKELKTHGMEYSQEDIGLSQVSNFTNVVRAMQIDRGYGADEGFYVDQDGMLDIRCSQNYKDDRRKFISLSLLLSLIILFLNFHFSVDDNVESSGSSKDSGQNVIACPCDFAQVHNIDFLNISF